MFADLGLVELAMILLGVLIVFLASGVWIAIAPRPRRLCRDAVRRRQRADRARCSRRPSGARARRGRWRRCRCSSGWARSCSAPGCRSRCSAACRPGCNGCPGGSIHVNVHRLRHLRARCRARRPRPAPPSARSPCRSSRSAATTRRMSLGSLAGSGTLGLLIPPSIPMVVYAVRGERLGHPGVPGGFLPGLLVMALYSGYIIVWSLLNPDKTPPPRARRCRSCRSCGNRRS